MEFEFLESLYKKQANINSSDYLRERTISSMDCKEYKQKICPQTPRIKPQKAPEIPLLELNLPPIIEEAQEEDQNIQRTCQFSFNQFIEFDKQFDETSTENDTLSQISYSKSMMNIAGKVDLINSPSQVPQFVKSPLCIKKCKSMRVGKLKRMRAASFTLKRFSIYSFLKKIIKKQKHNEF